MNNYCVMVADAARARLFVLEEAGIGESGPNLVEISDLANTEIEAQGRGIYTNVRSGRNVAPASGGLHAYGDHRDRHVEENERSFARQIATALADVLAQRKPARLVIAAEPHMMGVLRQAMQDSVTGLKVEELGKELTKLSVHELHEYLAESRLLPARQVAPV